MLFLAELWIRLFVLFFFYPKLRLIITIKIFKTDDDHKRFAWTKNKYNYRAKSYLNDTSSYMYVRRRVT